MSGKPDLIVVNNNSNHARVIDVKAGQEHDWHRVQVMIYMYAIPRALPQYRNFSIAGEVVYPHGTRRIPQGGLPESFTQNLTKLTRSLAAPDPPPRVSSARECRHCDISAAECPDRIDAPYELVETVTNDF